MMPALQIDDGIELVDPERLASGQWCYRSQKTIGQGDICASYSADRIGMGEPVRKPFTWRGGMWVCTGIRYRAGNVTAEAYRLVHPQVFEGQAMTYAAKVADGDAARSGLRGFYHGMSVKHGGAVFILCGPPVTFAPGETEQLALL